MPFHQKDGWGWFWGFCLLRNKGLKRCHSDSGFILFLCHIFWYNQNRAVSSLDGVIHAPTVQGLTSAVISSCFLWSFLFIFEFWDLILKWVNSLFSSPGRRRCELLPSLGVCCHRSSLSSLTIFRHSSPMTLLDQLDQNLVWMFFGVSCTALMWGFFYLSKKMVTITKNRSYRSENSFSHILPSGKNVQHDEIYLWSNFHFNLFSHVGVIALFDIFLIFLMLFFQKSYPLTLFD